MKAYALIPGLLLLIACGGKAPSAPTSTTPVLTVDQTGTFVVARHETGQVHAQFGIPNQTQQDVTSAATWTSSNPAIVTVGAGTVKAVGIGSASIRVEYQGQSVTLPVTARRRTFVEGTIGVTNATGRQSIVVIVVQLDGKDVGYSATSHAHASMTVDVTSFFPATTVTPGSHELALSVPEEILVDGPNTYISDSTSHINVIDLDTEEQLKVITLPVQQQVLSPTDKMTWTVQIDVFS